jgi:ribonuclease J
METADKPQKKSAQGRPAKGSFGKGNSVRNAAEGATLPAEAKEDAPKRVVTAKTRQPRQGAKQSGQRGKSHSTRAMSAKLRVIPLGGLHEVGKNITAFEYDDEIIVLDCGVAFPTDDMPGIDLVIPDFTYLIQNKDKVKGIVITHGHEDHIGSLPYLLRELKVPVYGTRLTIGLIESKLREHNLLDSVERFNINAGETFKLGKHFKVEFIRSTHSIADSVAMAITTPVGVVVHSGDFKIDFTPIQGEMIDLQRFAELGKKGVLLFMCESTNIERPGYTMSERSVGAIFEKIFADAKGQRIMVATFSSNIDRIQQIINSSVAQKRKVCVVGRSMTNVVKTAIELGYLDIPKNTLIEVGEMRNYTDEQLTVIMTGSQGETMSALSRIAAGDHRQIEIRPSDKIIISASPIPGNEKSVYRVINELLKKGADVIYEGLMDVHVSGHARQEEIKILHSLVKPKFFMPVHGEYKMLKCHADVAMQLGMDKKNIFVMDNGDCLELNKTTAKLTTGAVPSGQVFVDGLGVGDVGNIVLRDRKHLAQDGLMIVVVAMDKYSGEILSGPDIISRGFVYVRESEELMVEAKSVVNEALNSCERRSINEWSYIKTLIKDTLRDYLWQKTKRSPMILPIVMDIE